MDRARQESFVVRVRIEASSFPDVDPQVRISVEHVGSGATTHTSSYDELGDVVQAMMRASDDR